MVLKVYISGMSGNKEVKKRQQRVLMILESKNIQYEAIDITEPGRETDKEFMQNKSTSNGATVSDPEPRHALPPQIFNEEEYCGDYDAFDLANEIDTLEQFLKVAPPVVETPAAAAASAQQENGETKANGEESGENKENEGGETTVTTEEEKAPKDGGEAAAEGENAENAEKTENSENGEENRDTENTKDAEQESSSAESKDKEGDETASDNKKETADEGEKAEKENDDEINTQQQQKTLESKQQGQTSKNIVDQFIESEQKATGI